MDERIAPCGGSLGKVARRDIALPAHLVVGLRPSVAANFAAAARLTTVEVAGLGLRRYSQVYPPLAGAGVQGDGRILYNAWAFTAASRFCPNCLGGDGDRLQQAHGGPWRQQWHLPITFACVRHERLLEYLCPHCRRPPSGRLGVKTSLLLHIHCEALHPTQCRNHALDAPLRRPRLLCGEHLAGEVNSVTPILDAWLGASLFRRAFSSVCACRRKSNPTRPTFTT